MNNLPELIQKEIKQTSITDLSLVETIASNFVPFISEVQEQIDLLKPLKLGDVEDMAKAKRISLDLGKIRSRKDKTKKEQKDYYLTVGRFIDSLSNTVEGMITLTQDEATSHVKYFENLEKQRLEKLKEERLELVRPYVTVDPVGLEIMTDDVFNAYLSGVKRNYEAEQEAIRIAEEERIKEQRLTELANERHKKVLPYSEFMDAAINLRTISEKEFNSYLKSLEKKKAEHLAEQERIRIENEKLKEEARLKEEASLNELIRIQRDHQREKMLTGIDVEPWDGCMDLSDDEFNSVYLEKKAVYDAEAERIKRLLEEEENRKAEEARKLEEIRKQEEEARKAPDKQKLFNAVTEVNIGQLSLSSKEAMETYTEIIQKLNGFKLWANNLITNKL